METFLSKYFVCCYDGEKLLGSQIETGTDTEAGKDIILDLRFGQGNVFAGDVNGRVGIGCRLMTLIEYHAQLVIKENSVDLSY